jgi:ribonuclease Y
MEIYLLLTIVILVATFVLFKIKPEIFSKSSSSTEENKSQAVEKTEVFLEAKAKAMEIVIDAKNEALKIKTESEDFVRNKKSEITNLEAKIGARESVLHLKSRTLNLK